MRYLTLGGRLIVATKFALVVAVVWGIVHFAGGFTRTYALQREAEMNTQLADETEAIRDMPIEQRQAALASMESRRQALAAMREDATEPDRVAAGNTRNRP